MAKKNDETSASLCKFIKGQNVLCCYQNMIYEAKCLELSTLDGVPKYFVHYKGWNNRWNEWVHEDRLLVINKDNLKLMKTVNKEQLKINEEKRSKTKNKNKTNLTPKKGRKRKLLEMSTELDTEEPVPSTSRSTIPKKKKDQPLKIPKTPTSEELKPSSASNKNVLLNCTFSRTISVVIEKLTDEQIREKTQKKTNTKTHKIITEKCDSIEINPTKECKKSSVVTNKNDANYISTIKPIDLCEKTSEFVGTSEVACSSNAETINNVNKKLNIINIEPDKCFPVWKQTSGSSCEVNKDDVLDASLLSCKSCGAVEIERVNVIGTIDGNSFKVIKINDIVNNCNTNMINFDSAQNKNIELKPLATENKNTTEVCINEHFETIKGKMSETETIQVDKLLENFPKDTAQNKNTEPKEVMTEINNTLGVSIIENFEASKNNFSEVETIQINELTECSEDISTLNTEPKDVTKLNCFLANDWDTFEKDYVETRKLITDSMNFSETDLNKKLKITSSANSSEIGVTDVSQLHKDTNETNSTSTTENIDNINNIFMESLIIPETEQNNSSEIEIADISELLEDTSKVNSSTTENIVNINNIYMDSLNIPETKQYKSSGISELLENTSKDNCTSTTENIKEINNIFLERSVILETEQNKILSTRRLPREVPRSINSSESSLSYEKFQTASEVNSPEINATDRNKLSEGTFEVVNISDTKNTDVTSNNVDTSDLTISEIEQIKSLDVRGVINPLEVDLNKKCETSKAIPPVLGTIKINKVSKSLIGVLSTSNIVTSPNKALLTKMSSSTCNTRTSEVINLEEASSKVISSSNSSTADDTNLAEQFKKNSEDQVIPLINICVPPPIIIVPCELRKELCYDWLLNNEFNRPMQGLVGITVADVLHGYSQSQTTYESKIRVRYFVLFILEYFNFEINNGLLYQNEHKRRLRRKLKAEFDFKFSSKIRRYPYFDVMGPRKKIHCFTYGPIYLLRLLAKISSCIMRKEYRMSREKFSVLAYYIQDLFCYIDSMREVYFPIEGEVVFKRQQIKFN